MQHTAVGLWEVVPWNSDACFLGLFDSPPHPFFLICSQRRRSLWGFPDDQGHCALGRDHNVDSTCQLQVLLHHGRHLLPLWPTELLHEVRLLDLRRKHGGPGPCGPLRGPKRLLRQWRVGDPQRHRSKGKQEGWGLLVPICYVLLHPEETALVLHPVPHHPLPRPLISDRAGVLFAIRRRRETVTFHICAGVAHCVPPGHRRNHSFIVKGWFLWTSLKSLNVPVEVIRRLYFFQSYVFLPLVILIEI